jgi:glycosyltransferase involved in cell wall biosynthesis
VIENWTPLDDVSPQPKDNPWSRDHGLADKFVFLCAGTLGLKHNPAHLANLARAFSDDAEVRVVVVSQGPGRTHLEQIKAREGLDNLILLDYQAFDRLSQVLSAADVSVLLLEAYAGILSVPSKVYSYLCVGRPIVGALPTTNLACRIVERENAGLCVAPNDEAGFIAAARRLRADPALRAALVERQRPYARHAFDIDRIGARFTALFEEVAGDWNRRR